MTTEENKEKTELFEIRAFRNQIRVNGDQTEAHIRPIAEIEMTRAATLFIAQYIDDMEMYPATRYELDKGLQSVFLKNMRIIRPRNGEYKISIKVFASAAGSAVSEISDACCIG